MVATLKELIESHGFGVKFRRPGIKLFIPKFIDIEHDVYGIDEDGLGEFYWATGRSSYNDWELYKEPQEERRVLYQFAVKHLTGAWSPTVTYYETAADVKKVYVHATDTEIKRLDYTKLEVWP